MKILIVDDDYTMRRVIQAYIAKHGTLDLAVNGEEGLELFKKAIDEKKPYDLVCLDIMMPEMDGLEFSIREQRKYENERRTKER